jgi:hypothetical protein
MDVRNERKYRYCFSMAERVTGWENTRGRQLSDRITELFHLLNIKILFFSSKHFVFSILFCTFVPRYTNISKRIIYGKGQIRGAVTEQAVPL